MQIACRSLPCSRPLRVGLALGLCALLGSSIARVSMTPRTEPLSTRFAIEAPGAPAAVPAPASQEAGGGEAPLDVAPLHRPVPSILLPMPRPYLELAAVSEGSFDDLPRPRPRSATVDGKGGMVERAERAQMGALLTEATALVEGPPTSLRNASALTCLAVSIYHEARNQPLLGQQAVAAGILRRVTISRWGDTICAVVQPSQFSYLSRDYSFPPILERAAWQQALTVAVQALIDGPTPLAAEADHYHATYVSPSWGQEMQEVMRIGGHVFYRDPRSGSHASAETHRRASRVQVAVKPLARSTY
jgi:spore germination cell wall hydrolase CwlJ-like protein